MNIKSIRLQNYRNYKDLRLNFGTEATIFIGKNGTGKTNIITAIKQLLSFVFSRKKGEPQYHFISSSDRNVISFRPLDARYGMDKEEFEFNYHYPIITTLTVNFGTNQSLEWSYEKDTPGKGLKETLYREANHKFWEIYNNGNGEMPIFAYFSDSYPHVDLKLSKNVKAMLESGNPLPRNTAYYKWDDDKNCTEIWLQYFTMQYKKSVLQKNDEAASFVNTVRDSLVKSSSPVSEYNTDEDIILKDVCIDFRGKAETVMFIFKDDRRISFSQLPTGYLRFFSIVLDIACRGYLLNRNCNPEGIVLIDELDLHLHPSVEQTVFKRLRNTFTRMQWIISTHSPLVLSAFEQKAQTNVIYKLINGVDGLEYLSIPNQQGVDASTNLKLTMDTPDEDSRLNDYKEAYEFWKSKGDKDKQEKIRLHIKTIVGEDSLLYKSLK